jgi:FkbM family methyltransferase
MYKKITGRWGDVTFLVKDEYVGKSLYYYGEYNPDETEKVMSIASSTCLDIGANIGCISQALLTLGHRVIAFEPQPEIFGLLTVNCPNALCYNMALGATKEVVTMPKVHYSTKGNFGGLGIGDKSPYGDISVDCNTLDSFGFENVGFIKIDVEGYELEVLQGGRETILRDKPIMYIEDDRAHKSRALRAYIELLGYKIEEHKPTLYREHNFFNLKKNVWDRNYASHNLIATPI